MSDLRLFAKDVNNYCTRECLAQDALFISSFISYLVLYFQRFYKVDYFSIPYAISNATKSTSPELAKCSQY